MTDAPLTMDTPLSEAQQWLRNRVDKGDNCPCCSQFAKVYRRKINAGMAQALIVMYRQSGGSWFRMPSIAHLWQSRDEAALAYWGLIEEAQEPREDGGRAGWWRLTQAGMLFASNRGTVPKYARVYNGRCLGLTGDPQSIIDALGNRFDYTELMRGI